MKKNIFYLIIVFSMIGCCKDQIVSSYKIPEEQKYLIPFEEDVLLTYISEQDFSFSADAKQKNLEIYEERTGPDSCDLWAFDVLKSSIFINMYELRLEFKLSRGFGDEELILTMRRLFQNGTYQDYQIENSNGRNYFSDDLFTDIEINGYHFNKVLIFKTPLMSSINQIIYSPENGIEYIEFVEGRYLKLDR